MKPLKKLWQIATQPNDNVWLAMLVAVLIGIGIVLFFHFLGEWFAQLVQ